MDGSKFFACNSKERNFTKAKLDDRISWLEGHIDEYLRLLDQTDEAEDPESPIILTRDEINSKLMEAEGRLAVYKAYQQKMEKEGLSQISLTDPDAKLMKMRYGYGVAYNVQTAVTSESHMIAARFPFEVSDVFSYFRHQLRNGILRTADLSGMGNTAGLSTFQTVCTFVPVPLDRAAFAYRRASAASVAKPRRIHDVFLNAQPFGV